MLLLYKNWTTCGEVLKLRSPVFCAGAGEWSKTVTVLTIRDATLKRTLQDLNVSTSLCVKCGKSRSVEVNNA